MATFTVYGSSDDLIELDGDISEEWSYYEGHDGARLVLSDGTVLTVVYDPEGRWRITVAETGTATVTVRACPAEADDPDDKDYSDVATVEGDVGWVAFGDERAEAG